MGDNQSKIESGEKVVLFVDESHLCWGDTCGYVWGRSDSRIEIPITNSKERQTYYGALNYHTKEFILEEYDAGNGENTKKFMELLQNKYSGKQITLIWDGASYHRCEIIKSFLASVNDGKPKDEWPLTCILFAPHDPRQNPVEDVWLRGKNFLRRMCSIFDFAKIHKYSPCSVLS